MLNGKARRDDAISLTGSGSLISCHNLLLRLSVIALSIVTLSAFFSGTAQAQDHLAEWEKKQEIEQRLQYLGDNLLGDSVDPASGQLVFTHTDVDIPGNSSLVVRITRKRTHGSRTYDTVNTEFGDWEIVVPKISAVAMDGAWPATGYQEPRWYTGNKRCSEPNQDNGYSRLFPLVTWTPGGHIPATTSLSERDYNNGVTLTTLRGGTSQIAQKTQNPTPGFLMPAQFPSVAKWVSTNNWHFTCTTVSNGGSGEGFVGHAPDGTKYTFDHERITRVPNPRLSSNIGDRRYEVALLATRVEDRFGNYVEYTYDTDSRLTRILGNDGREIQLTYHNGTDQTKLIKTVKAISPTSALNDRTWTYAYRRSNFIYPEWTFVHSGQQARYQVLDTVTRPDGRSWSFQLDGMDMTQDPNPLCNRTGQSTASLTHPYGTTGTFDLALVQQRLKAPHNELYRLKACEPYESFPGDPQHLHEETRPFYSRHTGVMKKTLTVPGAQDRVWMMSYSNNDSDEVNISNITDPEGITTRQETHYPREVFGGEVKKREVFDGSTRLQRIENVYTLEDQIGKGYGDASGAVTQKVLNSEIIFEQDGDTFYTQNTFNSAFSSASYSFGNPTRTETWSNFQSTKRQTDYTYLHLKQNWIIGLPRTTVQTDTLTLDTLTPSEFIYTSHADTASNKGLVSERRSFGNLNLKLGYNLTGTAAGTPSWVENALGHRTQLLQWHRGVPQELLRPDNNSVFQYVDDYGDLRQAIDAKGNVTTYQRDTMGRLTHVDLPGAYYNSVSIAYDFATGGTLPITQTITRDSGNTQTVIRYDSLFQAREIEQTTPGWSACRRTDYDGLGRVTFAARPETNCADPMSGTQTVYDPLGRVLTITDSADAAIFTQYTYGVQNSVRVDHPNTQYKITYRDGYSGPGRGETLRIEENGRTTLLNRDGFGRLLTLRQEEIGGTGKSVEQEFRYDSNNRLCAHYVPEHGQSNFTYYADGKVRIRSRGEPKQMTFCPYPTVSRTKYDYDSLGRLTHADNWSDPGSYDVMNVYDDNGNLLEIRRGLVSTVDDERVMLVANTRNVLTRTYDELNNVVTESQQIDGAPLTFNSTYTYDANGFRNSQKYPMGSTYLWDNDGFGHQLHLRSSASNPNNAYYYANNITYHPDGSLAGYTMGNGQVFTRSLDSLQRTLNLWSSDGALTALDLTYAYDPGSRIASINDLATAAFGAAGKTHSVSNIQYDGLGQLTTADGWWGTGAFTYDGLGNLLTRTLGAGTPQARAFTNAYDTPTNRLTRSIDSLGTASGGKGDRWLSYDARGNITQSGSQSMGYNYDGQMTTVSGTAPGIGLVDGYYVYNGEQKRVRSVVNGRESFYVYDARGRLLTSYKSQDGEAVERLYLESGQALGKRTSGTTSALTYLHTDHLGTPIRGTHGWGTQDNAQGVTATSGDEVFSDFSTPYGLNPLPLWHGNTGSGFDPATGQGSNCGVTGFTTHVKDCETGLQHMQARYYDPGLVRFTSVDPVDYLQQPYTGQVNRYAYTWNNPVNATDPDGEFLNFVAKFAVDVALEVAIQAASGEQINLGAAAKGAALGIVDPTKTVRKAAKLAKLANTARKGCNGCFVAGTLVDTEDGLQPIETLEVGDLVWAKDDITGDIALKPITHLIRPGERPIYELTAVSKEPALIVSADSLSPVSPKATVSTFHVTDDHPWWVQGQGWLRTDQLASGMTLITRDGQSLSIDTITLTDRVEEAFNITVADYHTYFVGEARVWTHNSCPTTLKPGPNASESTPITRGRLNANEQKSVNELGDKNGCHTCGTTEPGTKSGNWVGDHQPPQATDPGREVFDGYPHCLSCSRKQGGETTQALRKKKDD